MLSVRTSLGSLSERTRTIGLLLLVVNSIFGVSLFAGATTEALSDTEFTIAVGVLGVVLVASVAAIAKIEIASAKADGGVVASGLTPYRGMLTELVNGALQMMCRAASLPHTPESAQLRVFIFRVEGDQLVCRYFWSPNPTKEEVGRTRFTVGARIADEIAVVRCVLSRRITRAEVSPLSHDATNASEGGVRHDLQFVLAAPILNADGTVWGTVDFDTSTQIGEALLSTEVSDAAMFQLVQHLQLIFRADHGAAVV